MNTMSVIEKPINDEDSSRNEYASLMQPYEIDESITFNTIREDLRDSYKLIKGENGEVALNFGLGWKLHLNVEADKEKIETVSKHLKDVGYPHAYLSDGDVSIGQIFTVYCGSREKTEDIIKLLTEEIGKYLEEVPAENAGENVVAKGITASFRYKNRQYKRYGVYIDTAEDPIYLTENQVAILVKEAKEKALKNYGDFYGGDIPYYSPTSATEK